MIIDFHTHIFPDHIKEDRTSYFTSEPEFELLYNSPKSKLATAEDIIAAMDENKVDRSVVFGFPWRNIQTIKSHNDYIIDAVNRFPKRLIGFCCVDPTAENADAETIRCLDAGLSGVGEIAFYGSGIDQTALDALSPIMDICKKRNCPILIHTNEPIGHDYPGKSPISVTQIFNLINRYKDNILILAHWGGGVFFYNLLKKSIKERFENVFVDTAASPFLYDPLIYPTAVKIFGAEKILLGSDFPLIPPKRYVDEMAQIGLSEKDQEKILGLNAQTLLSL